ncbi:hypothetical protein [Labilibaculum antarcticum]|uniref:Uncharacterized protein n=1 Tax=Labilibaculum antarcticum TaxID=1717717 RepID=A0A1Y1CNG7_9BACT|nr:hypothetical protein [Labilibaculum antarcticum]BAX81905.1 hypothetical protein ALGA_3613 [Labilibaculum antarcticum]
MTERIHHYCTANEVSSAVTNLLIAFAKGDWSNDAVLTTLLGFLGTENVVLTKGLQLTKASIHSKDLHEMDELADKAFVCVKKFLWANTYELDENKAKDARELWKVFDIHDMNMHRKSYKSQMIISKLLIVNLNEPELKQKMAGLTGVESLFDKFVKTSGNLRIQFLETQNTVTGVAKVIAPSAQRRVVRKIVNEQLLPYLDAVVVAFPEKYAAICKLIHEYIMSANIKARSRKARNSKDAEVSVKKVLLIQETN